MQNVVDLLKQLETQAKLEKLRGDVLGCVTLDEFLIERLTDFDDASILPFFACLLDKASQKARLRGWRHISVDLGALAADLREKIEGVH